MAEHPHLRPIELQDAADVLDAFAGDPEMKRQGDVTGLASARAYIEFITNTEQGNLGFAVELNHKCISVVAINGANQHKLGWFFYWMHRDFRGLGLTSRAAATVANWALDQGGFERLELGHRATNPVSGSIAKAAGFVHEGLDRKKFLINGVRVDALTYGRLVSDPIPPTSELPLCLKKS